MKPLISIAISCIAAIILSSCGEVEQPITDYRGQVKYETIAVSTKLAGRINTLYVHEGQAVKKGDTLAVLDIPEVNAKMMQSDGAISAANGQLNMALKGATLDQLNQIDSKITAAAAQYNFAQESYKRSKAMYEDSLVSLQQFDEVRMKREMAKAKVSALKSKRKEVSKSARAEQIAQAKGQLERAMGAKEEVLAANKEKVMTAPADMTIETISLQEGELLTPGFALFNGYKSNSVFFRFTIAESEIYSFELNQDITVTNPYIEQETAAKIVAIKQMPNYADITSVAPLYELSESIYELKVVPTSDVSEQSFFLNATVLIK